MTSVRTKGSYCDSTSLSRSHLLSEELAEDFANAAGVTLEEAERLLIMLGRTMQDRLVCGKPSGIPYLGVIHVYYEYNRRYNCTTLNRNKTKRYYAEELPDGIVKSVHARPRMYFSQEMKARVKSAPHTGNIDVHIDKVRDERKRKTGNKLAVRRSKRSRNVGGLGANSGKGGFKEGAERKTKPTKPAETYVSARRLRLPL